MIGNFSTFTAVGVISLLKGLIYFATDILVYWRYYPEGGATPPRAKFHLPALAGYDLRGVSVLDTLLIITWR